MAAVVDLNLKHRLLSFSVAIVVLAIFLGVSADGAEFRADDQAKVDSDEVINDDLYIFGDEIIIDGEVHGDVVVFGRVIRIRGIVQGDLIAAGQAIVIEGQVDDDARIAGQVLKLADSGSVAGDLIAAGFSLEAEESTSVGGDTIFAGYQAMFSGKHDGVVNAALANCEIAGEMNGDVNLTAEGDDAGTQAYVAGSPPPVGLPNVPPGLTLRESTRIAGDLKYRSTREANIDEGAQITGEVDFDQVKIAPSTSAPQQSLGSWLRQYASLAVIGLVLLVLAPNWTADVAESAEKRPFASLGFGALGVLAFPVLLFVICILIVLVAVIAGLVQLTSVVPVVLVLGFSAAAMLTVGFWFFTVFVAEILFSLIAGRWVLGRINADMAMNRFAAFITGLILLAVLASIPFVGGVIGWLVVLFAFGSFLIWLFNRNKPFTTRRESAVDVKPAAE